MTEQDRQKLIEQLLPTFITLEEYDKNRLTILPKKDEIYKLTLEHSLLTLRLTKEILKKIGENVTDFAIDTNNSLQKIIDSLYLSFDGKQLYPAFEDKAANLLYLVIKDHPFIDGNKRSAIALFHFYLSMNFRPIDETDEEMASNKVDMILMSKADLPPIFGFFAKFQTRMSKMDLTSLALQIALSRPEDKEIQIQLIIKLIQQSFREFYN